MGNNHYKSERLQDDSKKKKGSNDKNESTPNKEGDPKKKNGLNKKTEIAPYREGLTGFTQSPLTKFIKLAGQFGQDNNEEIYENDDDYEAREIKKLEDKYFYNAPEEMAAIRKDFENYSKENKMAKRKLLDYFGLICLDNTKFGNRFFNCVKGTTRQQTNSYLDFNKFLKAICMLSKNDGDERLKFIYSIFALDGENYIEKDEMINFFMIFYEAMSQVPFENPDMEQLKKKIGESTEHDVFVIIQDIVNDLYQNFGKKKNGVLFLEEWRKWIEEEPGMKEVLNYNFNDSKGFN